MRIALATCRELPSWEKDDVALVRALEDVGASVVTPAWDDESFDWSSCDRCLIRTTWDYVARCDAFVEWAYRCASQTMFFNAPDVVQWNTHKSYLRDLAKRGVRTIPTIWLEPNTQPDVASLMRDNGWSRGFLKPAVGATAHETLRFDDSEAQRATAQRHVDRLTHAGETALLQPYLPRVETEGEISFVYVDGQCTHAVQKIPVPGDFRVQDDFGASDKIYRPTQDERALADSVMRAVERDLLYARVDFLRDDSGQLLLNELELVEPLLFFRHAPESAKRLAVALLREG